MPLLSLLALATPAFGQQSQVIANPIEKAIQAGVAAVLGGILWVLWKHYKKERASWSKEKDTLKEDHKKELEQLNKGHKAEIDALRDRLEKEQVERRQESAGLWKQNNETTREVMTVVQNMIHAMEHNSRVIEAYTHEIEEEEEDDE